MVDNYIIIAYNPISNHMTFPEQQPALFSQPSRKSGIDALPRTEVARIISATESKYPYQQYLPQDVDAGLNLPTALAAMHAIDAKGQERGWEYQDLLNVLPVTRAALTTAGFANAREGLQALLTGTTGELSEILEKILPQDARKGVRGIAKTMIWVNNVDNMRVVAGLLIDEKKLEKRLVRLTRVQQELILDPGRTRALLALLNGEYVGFGSLAVSGLPEDAKKHLVGISPFSLEDMNAVNDLFNAIESKRNSAIQIEAHRLQVERQLERFDAAGSNIAKYATLGSESLVKNTLLFAGGTVGGAVGGTILFVDKSVGIIEGVIDKVKQNVAERKAAKIQ